MNATDALTERHVLGLMADHSPDLMALVDANGLIVYCNAAHTSHLGLAPDVLFGQSIFSLVHEADQRRVEKLFRSSGRRNTVRFSARWPATSGDAKTFESLGRWVPADGGRSRYLLVCSREISDRRLHSELTDTIELRRAALLLLNDAEEKRHDIARCIHDDLGQKLTAASIELALWKGDVDKGQSRTVSAIREKISVLTEHISSMIAFTRRMTATLRPRLLEEFGIAAAIEWHLERMHQRTGIICHFESRPENPRLDCAVAAHLFRMVVEITEGLTADGERLDVSLQCDSHRVSLRFWTDGGVIVLPTEVCARVLVLGGAICGEDGAGVLTLPLSRTIEPNWQGGATQRADA